MALHGSHEALPRPGLAASAPGHQFVFSDAGASLQYRFPASVEGHNHAFTHTETLSPQRSMASAADYTHTPSGARTLYPHLCITCFRPIIYMVIWPTFCLPRASAAMGINCPLPSLEHFLTMRALHSGHAHSIDLLHIPPILTIRPRPAGWIVPLL